MGYRAARRLQILLMSWLTLTFLAAWLPMVRGAMDGDSYQWGASLFGTYFGGAGTGGDYEFALLKAGVALVLLYFGWRRPNGIFRILLVGWLALGLADTLYNVLTSPESFRFHGDTLGVDLSLVVAAPALDGVMLVLAGWWALRAPVLPVPPLARPNHVLLATAAALLPIQYVLLSRGTGQETSDVVGVLLTMIGWVLFSTGLGLWRIVPRRAPAMVAAS